MSVVPGLQWPVRMGPLNRTARQTLILPIGAVLGDTNRRNVTVSRMASPPAIASNNRWVLEDITVVYNRDLTVVNVDSEIQWSLTGIPCDYLPDFKDVTDELFEDPDTVAASDTWGRDLSLDAQGGQFAEHFRERGVPLIRGKRYRSPFSFQINWQCGLRQRPDCRVDFFWRSYSDLELFGRITGAT